jgi:hypothetical protein
MLPATLSEALWISLSEVMECYFNRLDEVERVHKIEDVLDRRRVVKEGKEWLAEESRRMDAALEQIHQGREDSV